MIPNKKLLKYYLHLSFKDNSDFTCLNSLEVGDLSENNNDKPASLSIFIFLLIDLIQEICESPDFEII